MVCISLQSISEEELDAFVKRVEDAIEYGLTLGKEDIGRLLEAFKAMLLMQDKLAKNDLTIRKLRKLLGMVQASESLGRLMGKSDENSEARETKNPAKERSENRPSKKPKSEFSQKEIKVLPIEQASKGKFVQSALKASYANFSLQSFFVLQARLLLKLQFT